MKYNKIYFEKIELKKLKQESLQLKFEGERHDSMGKWNSSGVLAEVHVIGKYFVLTNPFNQKPFAVFESAGAINTWVVQKYGIQITKTEVTP